LNVITLVSSTRKSIGLDSKLDGVFLDALKKSLTEHFGSTWHLLLSDSSQRDFEAQYFASLRKGDKLANESLSYAPGYSISCAKGFFLELSVLPVKSSSNSSSNDEKSNKETINAFSAVLVVVLGGVSFLGASGVVQKGIPSVPVIPEKSFVASLLFFYFILAGFDALIKFTEETKDPKNVPRSFYISNLLSIALVLGICLAFVTTVDMRRLWKFDNGIGEILHKFLGGNTKMIVTYFAVLYMIITTFVTFLATTRYLFGLGDIYKGLDFMKVVTEAKVPINAVLFTLSTAALGIIVNHKESLVRAADFGLSALLLMVAAAATKSVVSQGKIPWIEGTTTAALAGFMGLSFMK
jgi:hypothetical protein